MKRRRNKPIYSFTLKFTTIQENNFIEKQFYELQELLKKNLHKNKWRFNWTCFLFMLLWTLSILTTLQKIVKICKKSNKSKKKIQGNSRASLLSFISGTVLTILNITLYASLIILIHDDLKWREMHFKFCSIQSDEMWTCTGTMTWRKKHRNMYT